MKDNDGINEGKKVVCIYINLPFSYLGRMCITQVRVDSSTKLTGFPF